ncbi:MAG: FapA family protein, partial [Treponema sp.]|nr:FapA family protein [Treponema sp.]
MAAIIAKGSIDISINPQETEAKLVFVPDDNGMGWDVSAVNKLAEEKNLSPLPSPAVLESFLQKASKTKTKDPMELLVCQGVLPEDPVPETITWEDLPVPADLAPYQEETLSKAKAPELYRIKVEKIKNEKKVIKPGALPFMPGKEEILVSWDKKETREKATVDPQPKEIKYTGKGKKLGTAVPPKPGKPGKNVFGKPLQPAVLEDTSFLLGAGIIRDKGSLVAQASGFIRIGGNWADLVPFAKPSWEIKTGADGLTRFFNFEPGDARFALPTAQEIFAEAKTQGAAEDTFINAASLDKTIAEAASNGIPLEAFSLVEAKEAAVRVDINEDKTRALLYLRKGTAGYQPLEMKAVSLAIKNSKVQGFDAEKLKADINAFVQGKDVELEGYVLAEGTPSTRGKDREVQVLAALLSEDEMKPILARLKAWRRPVHGEGVSIDEITGAAFVEKGAKLGEITSSQEGEAGKDIYGNLIPGLPGNDPELKLFQGIEQHGAVISAGRTGLLLIKAAERYFEAEIIDCRDAKIAVHISEDAMEAKADFVPEAGAGVPLTPENALKVLAALGIKKGVRAETIKKACALAKARGGVSGITVARGEPPVAKGACAIKWLVPVNPPWISGEDDVGEGSGRTVQVLAGAALVEFSTPIAEGRPGFDVKGNDIPVDKGTFYIVEHDDSIKEKALPNGGKRLIAV